MDPLSFWNYMGCVVVPMDRILDSDYDRSLYLKAVVDSLCRYLVQCFCGMSVKDKREHKKKMEEGFIRKQSKKLQQQAAKDSKKIRPRGRVSAPKSPPARWGIAPAREARALEGACTAASTLIEDGRGGGKGTSGGGRIC
jgi:hypothetical protein